MKVTMRVLICAGALAAGPMAVRAQSEPPARHFDVSLFNADSVAAPAPAADSFGPVAGPLAQPVAEQTPAPPPVNGAAADENLSKLYFHEWTWQTGVFAGGGVGIRTAFTTQFFDFGGHIGIVMTGEHLHGWMRGNFEYAGEFMPVYDVFLSNGTTAHGTSVKPIILRWNFTGAKRIAPYFQLEGGFLITDKNVPPGDTSSFNFNPGGSGGLTFFTRPGEAFVLEFGGIHHSSASLGNENPGYNVAFFFSMGYTWFHGYHNHK
jgi:lipid A 3-O-deacylase